MSKSVVLKHNIGFLSHLPVGSIIAWHKDLDGTPQLPPGWAECNGQTLDDPDSPYNGKALPDLNSQGRFLRGAVHSGDEQGDQLQTHQHPDAGHTHTSAHAHKMKIAGAGNHSHTAYAPRCDVDNPSAQGWPRNDKHHSFRSSDRGREHLVEKGAITTNGDHSHSGAVSKVTLEVSSQAQILDPINSRHGPETRPVNMSVVWIIKIKQVTAAWPSQALQAEEQAPPGAVYVSQAGNVGIGTPSPGAKLEVAGTVKASAFQGDGSLLTGISADRWSDGPDGAIYFNDGLVGIGTATPGAALDVSGFVHIESKISDLSLKLSGTANQNMFDSSNKNRTSAADLRFTGRNGLDDWVIIKNEGNVGIGTSGPMAKLTVDDPTGDTTWNTAAFHKPALGPHWSHIHWGPTGDWYIRSAANNGKVILQDTGGNVGIGTTGPNHKLHVNGETITSGITLSAGGRWWHRMSGDAAIVSDNGIYKALMIVGADYGQGRGRWVRLWDTLSVHGTKQFMIDHPLDPDHKYLIHATLEGPEVAVFYRGEAHLSKGQTSVSLPEYFEALTRKENRTVLLTPKYNADEAVSMLAASDIRDGKFTARMIDDNNPSQEFYWEVKALRADVGKLDVEIEKRRLDNP